MKRLFTVLFLISLFSISCIAQAKFYVKDGCSPSDGNASCVVAYFNADKSNVCWYEYRVSEVIQRLTSNSNYYNEWGQKYVNVQQTNDIVTIARPCRFYQNSNNAYVYITNFPSYIRDIGSNQPSIVPSIAFSTDFQKVRVLWFNSNPPLYNEVSKNQLVRPLF